MNEQFEQLTRENETYEMQLNELRSALDAHGGGMEELQKELQKYKVKVRTWRFVCVYWGCLSACLFCVLVTSECPTKCALAYGSLVSCVFAHSNRFVPHPVVYCPLLGHGPREEAQGAAGRRR